MDKPIPTIDEIIDVYKRTGSIWETGKILGVAGQTVHKKLARIKHPMRRCTVTDDEKLEIRMVYEQAVERGDVGVKLLANRLGMSAITVSRRAKEMGLTTNKRPLPKSVIDNFSDRMRTSRAMSGHPRGALGMQHTEETKAVIGQKSSLHWDSLTEEQRVIQTKKMLRSKIANGTYVTPRPKASWKSGWREIGGKRKYFRSMWESNYARYLEWLKVNGHILDWHHECKVFWFEGIRRGCVSYLPDFKVDELDGSESYHEVKGWMDDRSKTKLKRMAKYYPNVKMVLIDSKQYASLKKTISSVIPGWECGTRNRS